ncbi:serine protease [Streptomyces sp. NPDC059063]|uniref:serine protease n=1 Tax=unclassified Streptomyces TaxID=2593676 RepID=UPI0036AA692E
MEIRSWCRGLLGAGAALLLVGAVQSGPAAADGAGDRIVGGHPVDIKDHPYQVSLQHNGSHICGGTLVKPGTVVTAAHCTDDVRPATLSVRCGSSYHDTGGQVRRVRSAVEHPRWNPETSDNDASVLKLRGTCAGLWTAQLAKREPAAGRSMIVTGWGALREGGDGPRKLRRVDVPVVDRKTCNRAYDGDITRRMICAGVPEGGKDACQGDSGGPLVQNGILYGIVSWGYGCARPGYPGVYADVADLRGFIDRYV